MVSLPDFISSTGRTVPVELRRRRGTRHLRLSYSLENRIVVSKPWHCSYRACQKFIEQHRAWLEAQIGSSPEVIGVSEWLKQSPFLTVGGSRMEVGLQTSSGERAGYLIFPEQGRIEVKLPESGGQHALTQVIRKLAKQALSERTMHLAGLHRLHPSRISVRNQSSRWGSCSSKRGISLNWRLILVAPELQDYVILHELAHLTEMNHSKNFWRVLNEYDPEYRTHEEALGALVPQLMRVIG